LLDWVYYGGTGFPNLADKFNGEKFLPVVNVKLENIDKFHQSGKINTYSQVSR
jgi:hypothetical protein